MEENTNKTNRVIKTTAMYPNKGCGFPPLESMGYALDVIDGDLSDLRFTDPVGVIVGLKTKGAARKVEIGRGHFVQQGI